MLFRPDAPVRTVQYVPGHNRWHPDIPPVAEMIAGGSVRLWCEGHDLLCGPVAVVGAEPGDLVMVEVVGIGRTDGGHAPTGHPGMLGCAPSHAMLRHAGDHTSGALLGRIPPASSDHARVAAYAAPARTSCRALTPRSQILLPVHAKGARISVGDLHFREGIGCRTRDGWIDLQVHLTKRGMERFRVTEPVVMPMTTRLSGRERRGADHRRRLKARENRRDGGGDRRSTL